MFVRIRQWNEENKQRQAVASPEQSPAKLPGGEEEDFVDDGSTTGGVLHEEQFHEIKMPGDINFIASPMLPVSLISCH